MTNTTALDLDRLEALAKNAEQMFAKWFTTHQIADGVTDEDAGKLIAAMTPETVQELIQLARRSRPVEAQASADDILRATAKRICDRWDAEVPSEEISEEHRDLRAALAAKGQQDPVGWIYGNSYWEVGNPRLTDHIKQFGQPRFAAPVAQQSEAGARLLALAGEEYADAGASIQHGADNADVPEWARIVVRMFGQPTEAGAPTAAASADEAAEMKRLHDALCFWLPQSHAGLPDAMQERIAADAYLLVGYDDMPDPKSAEELGWITAAPTSGRESAAPAAPVREGDREQDAKEAARYRWIEENARTEGGGHGFTITVYVPFDEEDMGVGIDAAMQKGAQQ